MPLPDDAARAARAKRLREEIDQLMGKGDKAVTPTSPDVAPPVHESPREFVQRRMRELKQGDGSAKEG
jgi:hypothetical protein